MNIAVIIAGGVGRRVGNYIPKQFIHVKDKPIIAYTLECFQNNATIDAIEVVCVDGWEAVLESYALQYGISKLKWIVKGGDTSQESIYIGLKYLTDKASLEDIIVVHDGIRPMVSDEIIGDCIRVCQEKGNGVSAIPIYEQVFVSLEADSSDRYIPRENLRIVQTPQAYIYGKLLDVYDRGYEISKGKYASSYANTLMVDMGEIIYYSLGSTKNIKITTSDDIEIFRAMI